MSDKKNVVSIQNVSLEYNSEHGKVTALENASLDIEKGEFICVLGPSGCGKSTLLNIIAGFIHPTNGKALMGNKEIRSPDWRRGVVFQTPPLFPWLNIYDNIAYGPRKRKLPADEINERVNTYMDLVGLTDFRKQKPYELSGGMKQRASLARVLVNNPEMILMDEPLGALDALTRANMQTLIRSIWKKTGNTIFFITHDVDEALSLATRVIVMSPRPGRIVREIHTNFSEAIETDHNASVRYTPEYKEVREQILSVINAQ